MTDARSRTDREDDERPRRTPPSPMITRDSYRQIDLYAPDRSPCATDLSDNTNLWGVPPRAARALRDAGAAAVTRYPSLYASQLKEALAEQAGVTTYSIRPSAPSPSPGTGLRCPTRRSP